MDFMGDESLYRPSDLGSASVMPARVLAGSQMEEPLTLTYTAGRAGLEEESAVIFSMRGQGPLGFNWETGNPEHPGSLSIEGPGHCELEPSPRGFRVKKGRLGEGETVTLRIQRPQKLRWTPLAGKREFKVVIDPGHGEPQRRLPAPLVIHVSPRPFDHLEATVPCTREPGKPLVVHVTARDEFDNRVPFSGHVDLRLGVQGIVVPMVRGIANAPVGAPAQGVLRAQASLHEGRIMCRSNVNVPGNDYHLYVGDLHCHDFLSEAEGYTDAIYHWAIEDRALDFISVVPQSHGWHDNETWTIVKYMNERFLEEGRFVTFLGFEWQQTGYGDKVIHYLGGDQPVLPVDDGRYSSAPKLYEALKGSDALVISHHPAYPPGSWCSNTDFSVLETDVERVVEIWSMHGSSEGYDPGDRPLRRVHEPSLVMEALRRGVRVGFVAGSDTHSARPGGSAKEPLGYWGGLAAVWAKSLTRRDVFEALRARRTCALTGARIILWMTVNDAPMGSEIPASPEARIRVNIWSPGRLKKVEIVKDTRLLRAFEAEGDECHLEFEDRTGGPAFYHCRVTQEDGQLAVSSPVWVG
jgi:hypothetical protein